MSRVISCSLPQGGDKFLEFFLVAMVMIQNICFLLVENVRCGVFCRKKAAKRNNSILFNERITWAILHEVLKHEPRGECFKNPSVI